MRRRFLIVAGALLAFLLPLRLYRAAIENSLTVDETFSVMLTTHSVLELLELAQVDQHPPGFYLLLKSWHWLGSSMGIPPSVFWSRLSSVGCWVLLVLACAWFSSAWLGTGEALLLCLVICGGSAAADVSRLAGIYAIPFMMLLIAFFSLRTELSSPPTGRRPSIVPLIFYIIAAATALWVHLLSAVVLALYAFIGFASCARGPDRKQRLLRAILAHVGIVLLFLPWAIKLPSQLTAFSSDPRTWTTPPTLANLLYVFTIWYPFGSISENAEWIRPWEVMLGAAAILVPLLTHAIVWYRSQPHSLTALALTGWCALAMSCANVLLLWGIERIGLAHTFHGPRYPVFTASLWALGIGALSIDAARRLNWPIITALFLCVPWLSSAMLGQAWALKLEKNSGLQNLSRHVADFPKPGDTVLVVPAELIPYQRALISRLHARPIEQLFDMADSTNDVAVLNLNPWPGTDKPADVFVRAVLNSGQLSQRHDSQKIPNGIMGTTLHWLRGYNHDAAAQLRQLNFAPPPPPVPPTAISTALAQDQRLTDGWSAINATTSLYFTRFIRGSSAPLEFTGSVEPGEYRLTLIGQYFAKAGSPAVEVTLDAVGEASQERFSTPVGSFSPSIPLRLTKAHNPLIVRLTIPAAAARTRSSALRPEFHLFFAWLEKA